jgi:hypothetical protein
LLPTDDAKHCIISPELISTFSALDENLPDDNEKLIIDDVFDSISNDFDKSPSPIASNEIIVKS